MSTLPAPLDGRPGGDPLVPVRAAGPSPARSVWRRFRRDRMAVGGLVVLVAMALIALLAPAIVALVGARPPDAQSTQYLDAFGTPTGPSAENLFGVDTLGRDVFSRVLYGARVSLEVALGATVLVVVFGVAAGLVAGYYRGWVDTVLSRLMDVMLAFPVLLLALGLGAACSIGEGCLVVGGTALIQPGVPLMIVIVALSGWPYMARVVRGQALTLREREFVDAARALGATDRRILLHHLLPNLAAPVVVYTTLLLPANILFEAALSFLGVGVQPPQASWGAMIFDASGTFDTAWWTFAFPGLALVLTVLAFNLAGDGLRDALDPRMGH